MNPRNSFPHKLILLSAVQTCICHHLCTACCAGHYHVGQCWAGHCCTGQYWAGRTIISYYSENSFTSCARLIVYISPCHACVKLILRIWNTFGKGRRVIPPPLTQWTRSSSARPAASSHSQHFPHNALYKQEG